MNETRVGEPPDGDRLASLRVSLEEQRSDRLAQLDGETSDELLDGGDVAVARERETSLRHTLEEIEEALGRLDDGTYGRCETCDGTIPIERLEIRPYTRFCVGCGPRATHG